jgi:hypothetical protein
MLSNKLKLNEDKTEILIISTPQQKAKLSIPCLNVGSCVIKPSQQARNIGVIFDDTMKMKSQINAICKKAYLHLKNIRSVRKSLTYKATEQLIHAFVTTALDNNNALLYGSPGIRMMQQGY